MADTQNVATYTVFLNTIHSVGRQEDIDFGTTQADLNLTPSYKMRALAQPGPGYVTWVVEESPDFSGTFAPTAIQPGTTVTSVIWNAGDIQYLRVPTIDNIQNLSVAGSVTDPGQGAALVLVNTAAGSWNDLDSISLPGSPTSGAEIWVKDDGGQANVKRITVQGNGHNIDGSTSRLVDTARGSVHVFYEGSQWRVV